MYNFASSFRTCIVLSTVVRLANIIGTTVVRIADIIGVSLRNLRKNAVASPEDAVASPEDAV